MKTRRDIFGGLMLAAAALVCLTGCKKDDEGEKITLGVDFEQTAGMQKTYIGNGDKTIYWSTDDQVQVNGTNYLVHDGVVEVNMCDDGYAAVYPATNTLTYSSETHSGKTCIGGSVVIPATQTYTTDAKGIQQLNGPMAARLDTKTGRLLFRNLYAVVKVTVQAKSDAPFTLNSITVESTNGVNLSGTQAFSFSSATNTEAPVFEGEPENGSTCVTLNFSDAVNISKGETKAFYLHTLPFSGANLCIRLNGNMTDHPETLRKNIEIKRSCLRWTNVYVDNIRNYVDLGLADNLGLSVLWAPCNVGAANPGEFGDYFAWGETEKKEEYTWDTYKHFKILENQIIGPANMKKYNASDSKTILDPEDDAAHVKWGDSWRMPTEYDIKQLLGCTWISTENYLGKGIKGYIVAGKAGYEDKCIFLPKAGYYNGKVIMPDQLLIWSSSLNTENNMGMAKCIYETTFYLSGIRYCGAPVRPVMPKPIE